MNHPTRQHHSLSHKVTTIGFRQAVLGAILVCFWSLPTMGQLPETVAEKSNFKATSKHSEVIDFLNQVADSAKHIEVIEIGKTVEQRPMVAAMIGTTSLTERSEKTRVLLIGNIHSGECAGKEALLMLTRELSRSPDHRLLDNLEILVLPNYNADGNERMSKLNRTNQVGPEHGKGTRENAQGLDLNRDFIKMEAPETAALVSIFNTWDPHIFIDTHTTNGSPHRYHLTYDIPHNPAAPAPIREFLRHKMMPHVTEQLDKIGIPTFFYGNLNRERTIWQTYGHEPRYSTEYAGMRGRLGILSEAYAYVSYQKRIAASKEFVRGCLEYANKNSEEIRNLIAQVDSETSAAPQAKKPIAVKAELAPLPGKIKIKAYDSTTRKPQPGAKPVDFDVEFIGIAKATHEVERPAAYVINADQSRVAAKLHNHGIAVEQIHVATSLKVESARLDSFSQNRSFQGHAMRTATVTLKVEERQFPAGSYLVRIDQPLGSLAAYLLEPESEDGLLTWNFWDTEIRKGDVLPVARLMSVQGVKTKRLQTIEPTQRLSLEKIYGRRVPFSGSFGLSRWFGKTNMFLERGGTGHRLVDPHSGLTKPLYDKEKLIAALKELPGLSESDVSKMASLPGAIFSPSDDAVLINFAKDLFYWKLDSLSAIQVTHSADPEELVKFSPDGTLVAYVQNYNIHVADVATGRNWRVTTEGHELYLHGKLDWVYQEEIYGRGNFKAFWWSPDSTRIAYLRLDESPVKEYTVTDHIPVRGKLEVTRYPKAGDPLPHVDLGIVRILNGTTTWIDRDEYDPEDLIVRVSWSLDSRKLFYQVQNRIQTWLDLRSADIETGGNRKLFREESPGWVEALGNPHWLKDGRFLWLSDRSGQRQVYVISKNGKEALRVSPAGVEVSELLGVDDSNDWAYYLAYDESFLATSGYRVHIDGTDVQHLTSHPGNHTVRPSADFSLFIDYRSGVHTPAQTWLHDNDGSMIRSLDPNTADHLPHYRVSRPEFMTVPTGDGGMMNAMMIKPFDFDPAKKYPVMCYIYSGPQAPVVRDRWSGSTYLWHQMLAQKGYVVWMCDNRSASTRGIKESWPIHNQMGVHELKDIETGLDWLRKNSWVDSTRIGIWGWSYGGYMTGFALTHSSSFKVGISGAPVTDWKNYDAIYTERYMGLPDENKKGYSSSSVLDSAKNLSGKLLLIHGTIDDNVHLSNSLQFAYELQKSHKSFQLMLYPRNRHGITAPQQTLHLRRLMTDFILNEL